MSKCPILINAAAGPQNRRLAPDQLRDLCSRIGLEADVVETHSREQMCDAVTRATDSRLPWIGIAGGDGTIHAATQLLANSGTALAVLPLGTRNNFAHAVGLPLDPNAALKVIQSGYVVDVDLGVARCGSACERFTEAAGVGVFADILDAYGPSNKNVWRGVYAIVRTMLTLRARRLRLTLDGDRITERAVMCTVANGYRMGLGATIAPGASVTDGALDVVVIGDITRLELIRYYRAVKARRQEEMPKFSLLRAKSVRIESARPMAVHVDDRVLGYTPVEVQVEPRALKVVVKAP